MTIVHAHDLTRHDLQMLGNNTAAEVRRDPADIEAQQRSLATLGEEMDAEIEAAIVSEEVAS